MKYQTPDEMITKVYKNRGRKDLTLFSVGAPSEELLPVASLNRQLLIAGREMKGSGTGYDELAGNQKLRLAIAARSYTWGGNYSRMISLRLQAA